MPSSRICADEGQLAGRWRRESERRRTVVEVQPFRPLKRNEERAPRRKQPAWSIMNLSAKISYCDVVIAVIRVTMLMGHRPVGLRGSAEDTAAGAISSRPGAVRQQQQSRSRSFMLWWRSTTVYAWSHEAASTRYGPQTAAMTESRGEAVSS